MLKSSISIALRIKCHNHATITIVRRNAMANAGSTSFAAGTMTLSIVVVMQSWPLSCRWRDLASSRLVSVSVCHSSLFSDFCLFPFYLHEGFLYSRCELLMSFYLSQLANRTTIILPWPKAKLVFILSLSPPVCDDCLISLLTLTCLGMFSFVYYECLKQFCFVSPGPTYFSDPLSPVVIGMLFTV